MLIQAISYFCIKSFLGNHHVIVSFLNVPMIKWFVYFYDIWYPVIAINAFIIYCFDFENYKKLLFTMIIGALMSHLTFLIYPTIIIRPEIDVKSFTDFILDFTYKTDTPAVNCLPSVHCLFCFIGSYYILKTKNLKSIYKSIVIIIMSLIVLSTLFINQHIIEDVILSLIYSIIKIIIVYKFKDTINKLLKFLF